MSNNGVVGVAARLRLSSGSSRKGSLSITVTETVVARCSRGLTLPRPRGMLRMRSPHGSRTQRDDVCVSRSFPFSHFIPSEAPAYEKVLPIFGVGLCHPLG